MSGYELAMASLRKATSKSMGKPQPFIGYEPKSTTSATGAKASGNGQHMNIVEGNEPPTVKARTGIHPSQMMGLAKPTGPPPPPWRPDGTPEGTVQTPKAAISLPWKSPPAFSPRVPETPEGLGGFLDNATQVLQSTVQQVTTFVQQIARDGERISNEQQTSHQRAQDLEEMYRQVFNTLQPQMQQHLQNYYDRKWEELKLEAEQQYNQAKRAMIDELLRREREMENALNSAEQRTRVHFQTMSDEHTRILTLARGVETERDLLRAENTRLKNALEEKDNDIRSLNTRLTQQRHTLDENGMILQQMETRVSTIQQTEQRLNADLVQRNAEVVAGRTREQALIDETARLRTELTEGMERLTHPVGHDLGPLLEVERRKKEKYGEELTTLESMVD
eukprot:440341-Amphidinium_carterae.1